MIGFYIAALGIKWIGRLGVTGSKKKEREVMEKSNRENVSQARNAEIKLDSQIAAQIRRIFLANAPERKGGLKRQIKS